MAPCTAARPAALLPPPDTVTPPPPDGAVVGVVPPTAGPAPVAAAVAAWLAAELGVGRRCAAPLTVLATWPPATPGPPRPGVPTTWWRWPPRGRGGGLGRRLLGDLLGEGSLHLGEGGLGQRGGRTGLLGRLVRRLAGRSDSAPRRGAWPGWPSARAVRTAPWRPRWPGRRYRGAGRGSGSGRGRSAPRTGARPPPRRCR